MATSIQTQHEVKNLPPWLAPIETGPTGGANQFLAAQANLPNLTELANLVPGLTIPGLTPEMQAALDATYASGMNNPDLASSRAQLEALTSGPIGSSPATAAGMKAFNELVAPEIAQAQALQGTATGGAALEAQQQGATAAALPLIQNEIAQREQAVGQYQNLANATLQQRQAAYEAAGVPREIALQQALADQQQAQQKFQYEQGLQMVPVSMFPNFIGSDTLTRAHETMGAQDWTGFGLSVLGSLLGGGGGGQGAMGGGLG